MHWCRSFQQAGFCGATNGACLAAACMRTGDLDATLQQQQHWGRIDNYARFVVMLRSMKNIQNACVQPQFKLVPMAGGDIQTAAVKNYAIATNTKCSASPQPPAQQSSQGAISSVTTFTSSFNTIAPPIKPGGSHQSMAARSGVQLTLATADIQQQKSAINNSGFDNHANKVNHCC